MLNYTAPEDEGVLRLTLQITLDTPCPAATTVLSNEILLDIVTGLEDPADLQLKLHPNPAREMLFITNATGKPIHATMVDTHGKEWGQYAGKDLPWILRGCRKEFT